MNCMYSRFCGEESDECALTCPVHAKMLLLYSQLGLPQSLISVGMSSKVRTVDGTRFVDLFDTDNYITLICYEDYVNARVILVRNVMFLIHRKYMSMEPVAWFSYVDANTLIQYHYTGDVSGIRRCNDCDLLVIDNYRNIMSGSGKDIINELCLGRIRKHLNTIVLLDDYGSKDDKNIFRYLHKVVPNEYNIVYESRVRVR